MNGVILQMLEFFGIASIPTDFPTFIYWLCSLCAGLEFVQFTVGICFNFIKKVSEVQK